MALPDTSKAVIVNVQGPYLEDWEREAFQKFQPLGFILFQKNCENPEQLRRLTDELKDSVGRDCPILIDQEGGRVARLKAPHWREFPAMGSLESEDQVFETCTQISKELIEAGITVNCAPVLDVLCAETHDVIGDRAFGSDPEIVARLGAAACDAFLQAGITPIIKHIPGHGRGACDSHHELPCVNSDAQELEKKDFYPFKVVSEKFGKRLWAMTAHILYSAIDAENTASNSAVLIEDIIRNRIGFAGFLVSDDIHMKALDSLGTPLARMHEVLDAGCDAALICHATAEEIPMLLDATPVLTGPSRARLTSQFTGLAEAA